MLRTIMPASPDIGGLREVSPPRASLSSADGASAAMSARARSTVSAARIQSTTTSAMRLIRATRASSWWRTR